MGWNHQEVPYFSVPPAIHPSMIASTIPNIASGSPTVAPGAETVGQAQILTEVSKSFGLVGLFGVADEGAFASEEVTMGDNTPLRIFLSLDPSKPGGVSQHPTSDAGTVPQVRHQRYRSIRPMSLLPHTPPCDHGRLSHPLLHGPAKDLVIQKSPPNLPNDAHTSSLRRSSHQASTSSVESKKPQDIIGFFAGLNAYMSPVSTIAQEVASLYSAWERYPGRRGKGQYGARCV